MEESNGSEKPLICVLCGTPWGVKNPFTNNCENPDCSGFCSWGHEMNKPLSFTVKDDGQWVPNAPKTFGEEMADGIDKEVVDFLKDKSTAEPEDYRKQIRDGSHFIATKFFDFEKIFNFCQEHRVEVLLQDDTMMHCFIDYHLDDNKNKSSWAIEFDGFTALIRGIHEYTQYQEAKKNL
jgi:hypothetical protein